MKEIDKIIEKYDREDIYLAIKLEYKTLTDFSKKVGVSIKMVEKYIDEYLINGTAPKWNRKDAKGSFWTFLSALKLALRRYDEHIKELSEKYNLDQEVVKDILKDTFIAKKL